MLDSLHNRETLQKQHLEIQSRLDRYCDLFLGEANANNDFTVDESECKELDVEPPIDIFKELASLQNSLRDEKVDLCFCERENVCQCISSEVCECDGDDYHTVSDLEIIEGSNTNIIFEFLTLHNVVIPRLKNVRFFTLDKQTDDESWVMDLIKVVEKRKKKKVISKYFLKTKKHDAEGYIQYEIFDVPQLSGKRMQIKINYLQYHQL